MATIVLSTLHAETFADPAEEPSAIAVVNSVAPHGPRAVRGSGPIALSVLRAAFCQERRNNRLSEQQISRLERREARRYRLHLAMSGWVR